MILVRTFLLAGALAAPLRAQSVYVDFGSNPPSPAFAAAAAVPGTWNAVPMPIATPTALVDVQGASTPVTIEFDWSCDTGTCWPVLPTNDAEELLADWFNADCYLLPPSHAILRQLQPGLYLAHVYGYSEAACMGGTPRFVDVVGADIAASFSAATWSGSFAAANHTQFVIDVPASGVVDFRFDAGFVAGPAGLQLERLAADIVPYCFGAQNRCPCDTSNGSSTGGCATSWSAAGAGMSGTGTASISGDTITLTASNMSVAAATLIQGTGLWNARQTFGDGMICVTGTITRLVTRFAPGGSLVYPAAGDPALSVSGSVPIGGATRFYQGWFRNAPAFCTSATFNMTSAVAVVWH